MKKLILFLLLFVGCKTKQIPPPPPITTIDIVFRWYLVKHKEHYLRCKKEKWSDIDHREELMLFDKSDYIKELSKYQVKNQLFFYEKQQVNLIYAYRKRYIYRYKGIEFYPIEDVLMIDNSYVSYKEILNVYSEDEYTSKQFFLDDSLNIDGQFRAYNYKTLFKKGSGYWKDFYYGRSGHIKEEGSVQSNYKVGEWKYYNKNGTIDSLKTYSIKDSVDVRFPHCLFNKNEPCY